MWILLACAAPPDDSVRGDPTAGAPDPDDPTESIPAPPPRTPTAPGRVDLTCKEAIPVDGKTACSVRFAWAEGDAAWEGVAAVGIHGRSSAGFPKKQYAVELRDETGAGVPVDLFGMEADDDWLLNGMYLDRALFRNKLAYDLYRDMGNHAPDSVYVELTLDGAYQGVFLLGERIDHARVDQPDDDGSGASFVVRADEEGIPSSVQYAAWLPIYPDPAPDGVAARLAAVEARLLAGDDALWDLADLDGFVDFVLLEETVRNNDGYYLSHHLYTDRAGLLRFAPWDLDLTLGQPSYNDNELAEGWVLYRPDLVARPATQAVFRARMASRWSELRAGILATDAVIARMEGYRTFLGDAVTRNWETWDITQVPNVGFPLYVVSSADEEYAHVEAWTRQRLAWIDTNLAAY